MRRLAGLGLAVAVLMGSGCTQSEGTATPASEAAKTLQQSSQATATSVDPARVANLDAPGQTTQTWLEAIRTGDEARARSMLSQMAREKTADFNVGPPASDTARFEIGATKLIADDAAQVPTKWTDMDGNGGRRTEEMIWVLRREADGWRVAGVAATIFEGEPPLLLNFEDPDEMKKKEQWALEEIERRQSAMRQAKGGDPSAEPVRR